MSIKIKKLLFLLIFLGSCKASQVIPHPQPTGNDKLDIYLQNWITSYNITFCEKVLDVENDIDGYFCLETMTENRYYIPRPEWENAGLEYLFLRVSKKQLRTKFDKDKILNKYLCINRPKVNCKDLGSPNIMQEIQPWRQK